MTQPTSFHGSTERTGCDVIYDGTDSISYHLAEFQIACDPSDPRRIMPPPLPAAAKVLDIGCGAGQTLIAAYPDRLSYGIDIDLQALGIGKSLTSQVKFICGNAEELPFATASFDAVIARVSLPYVHLGKTFREIRRVLRPNGLLWMTLHPASMIWRRFRKANLKDRLRCIYIVVNSLLFHLVQREFSILGRRETFQTRRGISQVLLKDGFENITIEERLHFVVTATAGTSKEDR